MVISLHQASNAVEFLGVLSEAFMVESEDVLLFGICIGVCLCCGSGVAVLARLNCIKQLIYFYLTETYSFPYFVYNIGTQIEMDEPFAATRALFAESIYQFERQGKWILWHMCQQGNVNQFWCPRTT